MYGYNYLYDTPGKKASYDGDRTVPPCGDGSSPTCGDGSEPEIRSKGKVSLGENVDAWDLVQGYFDIIYL